MLDMNWDKEESQKHEVVVVAEVHLVDQLAGRIGKVMQIVMPASKDIFCQPIQTHRWASRSLLNHFQVVKEMEFR